MATHWQVAAARYNIFAARVDGSVPTPRSIPARRPSCWQQATGPPIWTGDGIRGIRLPMLGAADSLNISVTAAVLFYEALRQRERMRDEG